MEGFPKNTPENSNGPEAPKEGSEKKSRLRSALDVALEDGSVSARQAEQAEMLERKNAELRESHGSLSPSELREEIARAEKENNEQGVVELERLLVSKETEQTPEGEVEDILTEESLLREQIKSAEESNDEAEVLRLEGLLYEKEKERKKIEDKVSGLDGQREVIGGVEQRSALESAREVMARSEIALAREGLRGKRIEDVERAEEAAHAEHAYRSALRKERQDLLAALEGVENKDQKLREALIKTTALEATNLYDLKTEIMNSERPAGFSEVIFGKVRGVEKWYRSLRPRNKILIAGGLLAAGGAGAAIGGVVGAGVVGAALTGKTLQRILAGAGAGIGLEQIMKTAQSSQEKRAMERAFGSKGAEEIAAHFENSNSALDEALLRLESKQGSRKVRRYLLAATGGGLLASGAVASAFEYVSENSSGLVDSLRERWGLVPPSESQSFGGVDPIGLDGTLDEFSDTSNEGEVIKGGVVLPGAEVLPSMESYLVEPGDNMYSVLEKSFPEIGSLEGHAKANAIENILAVVKESPAEFGIASGDVNLLSVGDSIDIEKIGEIIDTEKVNGQSILERAWNLMSDPRSAEASGAGSTPSADSLLSQFDGDAQVEFEMPEYEPEPLTQTEAIKELGEFFRQTPGYLTHTVALEEFLEMIERGDVDAETLRLFEESVNGQAAELPTDRYAHEFDVLRGGEDVYGAEEYAKAEQDLSAVFDQLWGEPYGSTDSAGDTSILDIPEELPPSTVENSGFEIAPTGEAVTESVESTPLTYEQVSQKLDSLFGSASADITHSDVTERGGSWSQNIEGTISSSEYLQMSNSFQSFIDMIKSGELQAEDFERYISEGRGGQGRAHAHVYEFRLMRDPSSYTLSPHEVGMARRRLESLFRSLWLEKSA